MKTITKKLIALLLTALMALTFVGCKDKDAVETIQKNGVLKVGCKQDVLNFGYLNPDTSTYEGLEIEIAYEIAAKLFNLTPEEAKNQNKVEFTAVNATTRGPLLDNGDIDVVLATFTITDERKESWNFSTSYYTDSVGFLVLKDSGITKTEDLSGKVIGVSNAATTKDAVTEYLGEKNIEVSYKEFDTYPSIKLALSSGNVDVFSVDRGILSSYADDTTIMLEDRFKEQDYGAATKLENKGLTELVDGVIKDLISNGKLDEYKATFNLK